MRISDWSSDVCSSDLRMIPGDKESWYAEWRRIADDNQERGDDELKSGHVRTAMNCWLRAADYYRQAEFWLRPDETRRKRKSVVSGKRGSARGALGGRRYIKKQK